MSGQEPKQVLSYVPFKKVNLPLMSAPGHVAIIQLGDGSEVSVAITEQKNGDYDYTVEIEKDKKKTRITVDMDDGDKTTDVVNTDRNERYCRDETVHNQIVKTLQAIRRDGYLSVEEAQALKSAQEKLLGSMEKAGYDDAKTPSVVGAYQAAAGKASNIKG